MKRYAMVTRVRPGKLQQYTRLHAEVCPGVLEMIRRCNIRNYSIYAARLPDGEDYLFSYFEYTGEDFDADMRKMAEDADTQRWWAVCKPLLTSVVSLPPGEVWAPTKEVFHSD